METRPRLESGAVVLNVELIDVAGRGPHGVVWRARSLDGSIVALKAFETGTATAAAAFRRGVNTLEQLASNRRTVAHSPRVIAVSPDRLAVVEEYMANGDAFGLLALGWEPARIVEFLVELCRGVSALHDLGVVHGSLRPSNVLLDVDLVPVLSDAGRFVAAVPGEPARSDDAIYRAPEALVAGATPGRLADIYSLGQLLAFLLARGEVAGAVDAVTALAAVADCPLGLVRIVRKATTVGPAGRYQSVAELAQDLELSARSGGVGLPSKNPEFGTPASQVILVPTATRPEVAPPRRAIGTRIASQPGQGRMRRLERIVGLAGVAVAAVAGLGLLVTSLPSSALPVFSFALSAGATLTTFLVKRYDPNPLLQRGALILAALFLLTLVNPESVVVLRLRRTLERGTPAERALAAGELVRRGFLDLRGADLARATLVRVNLAGANLSRANLAGADLSEAGLTEANLEGATIREANLAGADLYGCSVSGAVGFLAASCDSATTMPEEWTCVNGRPYRHMDVKRSD